MSRPPVARVMVSDRLELCAEGKRPNSGLCLTCVCSRCVAFWFLGSDACMECRTDAPVSARQCRRARPSAVRTA